MVSGGGSESNQWSDCSYWSLITVWSLITFPNCVSNQEGLLSSYNTLPVFLFLLLCKICLVWKIDFQKSNSKRDEIASVGNSVRSQISLSCSSKRCRFLLISALLKASREEKWRYIQVVQSERKSRCHNFNFLQKSVLIFQPALVLLQKWPCPTFAITGGTKEN